MNSNRMWMVVLLAMALAVVGATPSDAASNYHKYMMKGSIVEASDEGIYLCIGSEDGAETGQVLDVVRVSRDTSGNPKGGARFKRHHVGKVEILEVVDEHFARAKKVSGEANVADMVELETKKK